MEGRVVRCEPPHVLAFTWPLQPTATTGDRENVSEVAIELSPAGREVRLVLTHRRLPHAAKSDFTQGWAMHLGRLADKLGGPDALAGEPSALNAADAA